MKPKPENIQCDWENSTWEGSRRAMIRKSLKLTARQRLQALENMNQTSQTLASLKLKKHT